MSSYVTKKITCSCCGKAFDVRLLKGFYNSFPLDLDTCPHNPAIFDKVVMCPACGYATDQVRADANDAVTNTVASEVYQKMVSDAELPIILKKEFLNAMIKERLGRYREAAFSYLRAYWYQREQDYYDEAALDTVIKLLSMYLEENMDIDAAIVLIDCQRQHADFADAKETALSLASYIDRDSYKRIIDFEIQLIVAGDRRPHSQREALV